MDKIISIRFLMDSKVMFIILYFNKYDYIKLKYYLKMLVDQCMMWCFFVVCRDIG